MIEDWVEKKVRRHLMRAGNDSAGKGRVANGSPRRSVYSMNTECNVDCQQRKHFQREAAAYPEQEAHRKAQCGKSARWV